MGGVAAARLTTAIAGYGSALASVGGAQTFVLVTGNLPPYTPAGTNASSAVTATSNASGLTSGGAISSGGGNLTTIAQTITGTAAAQVFTGTAQGGTSTPVVRVPPGLAVNKIIYTGV